MLEKIIKRSYELFSNYEVNSPLDICTHCCMPKENERLLAALPIKDIPIELLTEYNDGAATEKTPINEVKHFLPRYLALIGKFEFPSHSAELSLKRLNPFNKKEWNDEELILLKKFAAAFFKKCLSVYPLPNRDSIDSIIIMFGKAEFELTELLAVWETETTLESVLHFRDLYLFGFNNKNKLSNAFGENKISLIVRNWIDDKIVKQKISATIEKLIMEDNKIPEKDSNSVELLYEMMTSY